MRLDLEYIVLLTIMAVATVGLALPIIRAPQGMLIGPVCQDTDGPDQFRMGNVAGVTPGGRLFINIDTCDGAVLVEQTCTGSLPSKEIIPCEFGCFFGQCIPESAVVTPEPLAYEDTAGRIGTRTDLLELNEPLGSVRESVTETDLPFLRSGTITTRVGSTAYHQYLKFNRSADFPSQRVIFDEDEFGNVGAFFFVQDGSTLFDLLIQFDEGLRSRLADDRLRDMEDRTLNLMGIDYTIVDARVAGDQLTLTMLGGPTTMDLREGEEGEFLVKGKSHAYRVRIISEVSEEVLMEVDGQTLPLLRPGESTPLPDGTLLGVRDIIATAKDSQSSIVRIFGGASMLELRDTDTTDNAFTDGGVIANNEIIEDAAVRIRMSAIADQRAIDSITYRLKADSIGGDLFVPPGKGVREYLAEPEGLFAPSWDIQFRGLEETGTTLISLDPGGRDEYRLRFTNQEGLDYAVPLISTRLGGGLRFGDASGSRQRNLVFIEASSSSDFKIRDQDYIVLSDIDASGVTASSPVLAGFPGFSAGQTDNNAFTHVLQYQGFDPTNNVLTFTDLAAGSKQATLATNTSGTIIAGGISYDVFVDRDTGNISMEQNGDGSISGSTAVIATAGGALVLLGSSNPGGDGPVGSTNRMSITTLQKQFDQASSDTTVGITIEARSGNTLGISGLSGVTLSFLTSNPYLAQGMDDYGALYELNDPSGTTPEKLAVEYPLSQRGADVRIIGG